MQRSLFHMAIFLAAAYAGCSTPDRYDGWTTTEEPETTVGGAVAVAPVSAPSESAHRGAESPFVVHEWGTFTSLQGSDGEVVSGMHYEEESLPAFVYGRVPELPGAPKSIEPGFLEGVTQKLETPVVYFYGHSGPVKFAVDFPSGIISQWYPQATVSLPQRLGEMAPGTLAGGHMTWELEVLPAGVGEENIIEVPVDDVWAPSREVESRAVVHGDEEFEKFIFYRGLGRFETPFRATSNAEAVSLHNGSDQEVPDVFVLEITETTGQIHALGALPAGGVLGFTPTPKEHPPIERFRAGAMRDVAAALVRSGLYEDEAIAMVRTWEDSYFVNPGLRVLYVLPREWTDELLPLRVTPQPDEIVRTLVGRVEVMTQAEERDLLGIAESGAPLDIDRLGRFAEPRVQRLIRLSDDEGVRQRLFETLLEIRARQRP